MKTTFLIVLFIILLNPIFGQSEPLTTLSEILKPTQLAVNDSNIYVVEDSKISIYDKKTFKLVKTFGKKGQGPGEFPRGARIKLFSDHIFINSFDKTLVYSLDGVYKSEKKSPPFSFGIELIPGGYLLNKFEFNQKKKTAGSKIAIYDKDMKLIKNLHKEDMKLNINRKRYEIEVFKGNISYKVTKNFIIMGDNKKEFIIKLLDFKGKLLKTFIKDYKKIIISKTFKDKYIKESEEMMKRFPRASSIKREYTFPKYFPPFYSIYTAENMIYIFRNSPQNDKLNLWAMNEEGKIINKSTILKSQLFWIHKGVYYYLQENEDEETWELFAQKII